MGNLFAGWGGFIDLFCDEGLAFQWSDYCRIPGWRQPGIGPKTKTTPIIPTLQFAEWSYISRVVERNYSAHIVLNQCFYNFHNFLIGGNVTHR